ncbi:MAG: MFS transporter [Chloroherpetonaceae bacterium]|nr:MFS transporter [Chloroherpetonaceae bacterium]
MIQRYLSNFLSFHDDVRRYLAGAFLFNVGSSINDLLYNLYLHSLGYSDSFIGGMISLHSLGVLVLCVPGAFLARKHSHRSMLLASVSLVALFQALRSIFPNEFLIPFFNFALGLAVSAARVIPTVLLMRLSRSEERAFVFGFNAALSMFGIMLGNYLGGHLPSALVGGASLFDVSLSLDDAYQASLQAGSLVIALSLFSYAKLSQSEGLVSASASLWAEFLAQIPSRERLERIFSVITPHVIVSIGAGLVIPFIPLYLHQTFGASSAEIGGTMSLVQSAVAVGYLLSPLVSRRFGVLKSIIIVQLASLPFMAIMGFSSSLLVVTIAFLFRNVLMNMSGPFVEQYHMENVRDEEREFAASLDIFFWNLSWAITPAIAGAVIERFGYKPLFAATIGFYALSSFVYLATLKEKKRDEARSVKIEEGVA